MRYAATLVLALALTAHAQTVSPPPMPPEVPAPQPPPPQAPPMNPCQQPGAERDPRCQEPYPNGYSVPAPAQGEVVLPNINVPVSTGPVRPAAPAKAPATSGSGKGGGFNLSGMDGRACLVLAVVAVAALPAFVYAMDDDAEPAVVEQFRKTQFDVSLVGGTLTTSDTFGYTGIHAQLTHAHLGLEGSFEGSPYSTEYRSGGADFLIRPTPTQHLEVAIALGGRWSYFRGEQRFDAEIAVPHRYVFFRVGGQSGGLELRPAALIGPNGFDVRLDAAFVIPVASVASLQIGTRLFTFDFQQVNVALMGGLTAHF